MNASVSSGMDDERHFCQTEMEIGGPANASSTDGHQMKSDGVCQCKVLIGIPSNEDGCCLLLTLSHGDDTHWYRFDHREEL